MSMLVRWTPWVAIAWICGCWTNAFLCSDDSSCDGAEGRCEATGYCSFPDPSCESGRVYGEFSGPYAGQCVSGGAETEGQTTAASSDAGGSTSTDTPPTSGSTSTSTSTSDGASTSTDAVSAGSGGTTEATSDSDSESSSTGPEPTLGLCGDATTILEEGFSSLPLSEMTWTVSENGAVASVPNGVLHLAVDLPELESRPAYWGMSASTVLPAVGNAGVEIHMEPHPDHPAEIAIGLDDGTQFLHFDVLEGAIFAAVHVWGEGWESFVSIESDPIAHRWVRISWNEDAATLAFETSPDNETWTAFYEMSAASFDFDSAHFGIYGGAWRGIVQEDPLVAWDNGFVCSIE
jgi:hypothetical protein